MELTDAIQHLKESLADPTHKWGCEECKAEHEQLLEWLEDYKRLKDEMIPAYDEQLTEAQCKVIQQMREMKQLEADCIDLDKQLRDANSRVDARWISVKDAMPKDDEYVICLTMNGDFRIMVFDTDEERWYEGVTSYRSRCVTHWMPIPEQPK